MEWPPPATTLLPTGGFAEACADDDDDGTADEVSLVEYPVPATTQEQQQQQSPAAAIERTTNDNGQGGDDDGEPVAGATLMESASVEEDGSAVAITAAAVAEPSSTAQSPQQQSAIDIAEVEDSTPVEEDNSRLPTASATDLGATTPPPSTTPASAITETDNFAPTEKEQSQLPAISTADKVAPVEKEPSQPPTASSTDAGAPATPPPPSTTLQPPHSATTITSSDMGSMRSDLSSPLQHRMEEDCAPSSPLSEVSDVGEFDYDYDDVSGHRVIRLKPTAAQWDDFPGLLAFARKLGAREDGCFKLQLPADLRQPLPHKKKQVLPANAYKAKQIRRTTFWQLSTMKAEGEFYSPEGADAEPTDSIEATLKTLKTVFHKNKGRQMRNVRYRPDVPAWDSEQRREAGVPPNWSPIHPLRGDMLDRTKAVIPGIHTPYVYESAPHFGATFQIHAEDYRLLSLNHLYRGRKIWIVVPCTAIDVAEQALGRGADGCSQFMRHRAEFFFPEKLDKLGIPYRIVDQRPGETIVVLPDAYHEGYSTGYTLAEAKNYADDEWSTATYQPCAAGCQLLTAIPPEFMRLLTDGEDRLDLCKLHDQQAADAKRAADEMAGANEPVLESVPKRVKVE